MNLSDEALEPIVAKAILDSITPETREKLLSEAVKSLLAKPNNSSGYNQPSALQSAFNSSVQTVARNIAEEMLVNDEAFQANLKALFVEVSEKLFAIETREDLVSNIAGRIMTGLTKDRY